MRTILLIFVSLFFFQTNLTAQSWWKGGTSGEGPMVQRTLDLPSFWGIGLTMNADVYLTQGRTQSVTVEGQENILDLLSLDVNNGHWSIKTEENVNRYQKLKITITVPEMTKIGVSGSGDVYTSNSFSTTGEVSLKASGSGNIQFATTARNVDIGVSGSADIDLEGSAQSIDIRISGSGDVDAENFVVEDCEVRVSGSGDVKAHVNENLDVRVSGSGDVFYLGRPRVYSRMSGSGKLTSL